jgi:hypothetical protein
MPHFDSSVRGYSQKNKNKNNLKYIGEMWIIALEEITHEPYQFKLNYIRATFQK